MIAEVDILIRRSMHRQLILEVPDNFCACFAIPYAVAGQDDEFYILMQWLYDHVWVGCDHVVVEEPAVDDIT